MSITISAIISEYGAYYKDGGQNASRIKTMLTQGIETPKHCTPIVTDDTIYQISQGLFRTLVQPFQKAFTPKGGVEFKPKEIRLFKMKIDDELFPDEVEATWLGFLASNSIDRKSWPLVKWLVENYYIPQLNQDMELNEYFNGVHTAPTSGTAGADGTSMDGLKKLLTDGIADSSMNSLFTQIGKLDKDTIFDQIEASVDLISEIYQGIPMELCVSPKMYRAYMRDKRAQGFYQRTSDKDIDNKIDFTPQSVVPLPCMRDFDYFFATPKANLLHITKKSANKTNFKLEESKRAVAVLADWYEGLGFAMNEVVWTNWNGITVP